MLQLSLGDGKEFRVVPMMEMRTVARRAVHVVLLGCALLSWPLGPLAERVGDCEEKVIAAELEVTSDHPWRPPFGIDRVGAFPAVRVEITARQTPRRAYYLVGYRDGLEVARLPLMLTHDAATYNFFANATLTSVADEIALHSVCTRNGEVDTKEMARKPMEWPELQADAQALPDHRINPIDLGTVLVPHDWLVLVKGQTALIEAAAVSWRDDIPNANLKAWFEDGDSVEATIPLEHGKRAKHHFELPLTSGADNTVLHVRLMDGGRELWRKEIRTIVVEEVPSWPTFGAVEMKLRYDGPISVVHRTTGTLSSIGYEQGWDPSFNDVVVFLPNGTRFVFWRGSSYVPFWGGLYNTGFSYQWAETIPPPGFVDAVEPLHDKELRYSRVRIVESSPSRIHVRWTYQSVDVEYKSLGDTATEDFYFYPDGFGTRVVTLTTTRPEEYTFSEFIILTPQAAFPLAVLPNPTVDMLFLNGERKRITFPLQSGSYDRVDIPFPEEDEGTEYHLVERLMARYFRYQREQGKDVSVGLRRIGQFLRKISYPSGPVMYRVSDHKDDLATPIYFSSREYGKSLIAFAPFEDRGQLVSPAYWGDHWPLGRGALTGGAISNRIYSSPSHLSLMDLAEPEPLLIGSWKTLDAHGNAQKMTVLRRAWLIAKTDIPDDELLRWGASFSSPPSMRVTGARIDVPSYSQERRAIRLIAEKRDIQIYLKPEEYALNPVFELEQAPEELESVLLDGRPLSSVEYAWDGETLWLTADLTKRGARIDLRFR